MGCTEQHQALPPQPCQPPLCHPLSVPVCSFPIQLCPSVCAPVCLSPTPALPGHCLHLCPLWGVPYPCAPTGVTALGWEHPMANPRSGAGLTSRPPTLGRCWGGPGVAALPTPPALPARAGGAPGRSALPLPNRLRPLCASVSPFLRGGDSVSLPAKCFETHLHRCLPHRGRAAGPPPPPPQALLKGRGTSRIYVTPPPPQSLFKDPDKVYFIYLFSLVCGGTRPARLVLCNKHFGEISPRLCLVGVRGGAGRGAETTHSSALR